MKIKSREAECPESLVIALAKLQLAARELGLLSKTLQRQATLFDSDVVVGVLEGTAAQIDTHTETIEELKNEFVAFLSKL